MNTAEQLIKELSKLHLLKHPFYQKWSAGELTRDELKSYARQYYHHVKAFPRYISATHSNCDDIQSRQVLLANLTDEEQGPNHHPELWLRFAEGLGESRGNVENETLNPETQELMDTFFDLSRSSYEEGLGALFAYEQQVPEVAASKIGGLEKFYGIADERSLEFFNVHLTADVYHSEAAGALFEKLNDAQKERARLAAYRAAGALWRFLDGQKVEYGECKHSSVPEPKV